MRLARAGRMFGQDLLARERRVPPPATRRVPAHVAVRVPDVVAVFLVEGVVGVIFEALAPEVDAVVEGETEAFEEEGVLQAAEVLEVRVLAQGEVQVAHAEGEVHGEGVDGCGGDGGAEGGVGVGDVCVGRGEVFGEVGEDGGEAVVFVEAGEGASGELEGGLGQLVAFSWGIVERWRGRARAVNTSRPLSNRSAKPARTMLICSRTGTYALPAFKKTRRFSTSSATVSKSTLNQPPSSISCFFKPGVALDSCALNARFSSSPTASQLKFNDWTKFCRSLASSLWNRNLNSAVSILANLRRRSSVEEKASRRMKCE